MLVDYGILVINNVLDYYLLITFLFRLGSDLWSILLWNLLSSCQMNIIQVLLSISSNNGGPLAWRYKNMEAPLGFSSMSSDMIEVCFLKKYFVWSKAVFQGLVREIYRCDDKIWIQISNIVTLIIPCFWIVKEIRYSIRPTISETYSFLGRPSISETFLFMIKKTFYLSLTLSSLLLFFLLFSHSYFILSSFNH